MQDYEKHNLNYLRHKRKKIELEQEHIVLIIYNILCSLNFLHSANIMHRDLKPANILLKKDCSIKLCDFGYS